MSILAIAGCPAVTPALAYVGPAGIGFLGVLLAVVVVVLLGLVGLLLYPIRLMLRRRKRYASQRATEDGTAAPAATEPDAPSPDEND